MANLIVKDVFKNNEVVKEKAIKNAIKYILECDKELKNTANKVASNY